jgi:hypothetical protein
LSPILVRPVREQLEHDRVIRLLQAKYKRKFEVVMNPGNEQNAPVGTGPSPWFPDLVLQSQDRGRKLVGTVEVETTESINHLEAMSEWVTFSRLKAAFHLYVPTGSIDSVRRLCTDLNVNVAELWAYQSVGDQIRFTLVQRSAAAEQKLARAAAEAAAEKPKVAAKPAAAARPAGRNGAPSQARVGSPPPARPARQAAPAPAVRKSAAKVTKSGAAPARRATAAKAPARKATPRAQKRR